MKNLKLLELSKIVKNEIEISQKIEIRKDPITNVISRINMERLKRPKQKGISDYCPFCPQNIEIATPKFPKEIIKEGRIKIGRAIIFPNMYPLASLHGVCVFTQEHKININEINEDEIFDGLKCSIEFFNISRKLGYLYHFIGWNHLQEAGASILHPHFQLISSKNGLKNERFIFKKCKYYWKKKGRNYWEEIIEDNERFIGKTEGFSWITPWAPIGNYEVIGVGNKSSIIDLNDKELRGMANGITKIIKGLWELGIRALNMVIFSYPYQVEWFNLNVRIIARRLPSDRAFLEIYSGEIGIEVPPEVYSKFFKKFF